VVNGQLIDSSHICSSDMHKMLNKSYRRGKGSANRRSCAKRLAPREISSATVDQSRASWPDGSSPNLPSMMRSAVLILVAPLIMFAPAAAAQKFRADEWITECDRTAGIGSGDCSITIPFWQSRGEPRGSFALVIMLQTGNMGIVGQPFPQRAVLRVDKNPPIECRQARYCIFPSVQALAVLKQLKVGTLILIDVFTARGAYKFSLTPKGYQAGIAQIRAWGYRID
jgi:invasion protein IalB